MGRCPSDRCAPGLFLPADHGLVAWSYDPADTVGAATVANGEIRVVKLPIRRRARLTEIRWVVVTADQDPVAGQCQLALYGPSGDRLHTAIDIAGDVTTGGHKVSTIPGAPLIVDPPFVWVAPLVNFTTGGTFALARSTSGAFDGAFMNTGLDVTTARWALAASGQTALPATLNPAGFTFGGGASAWVGVA